MNASQESQDDAYEVYRKDNVLFIHCFHRTLQDYEVKLDMYRGTLDVF